MFKRILLLLSFFVLSTGIYAQLVAHQREERALTKGMKITRTAKIKKGVYRIDAPANAGSSAVIIEGDNITIDFNNAELKGSSKISQPDRFWGIGIIVQNSKSVTIKNLKTK